ncbi:hypothetical protein DTO96_102434 [Ephemeroptericola cinctiostellae]|uniref:Uncharacterized protein n=1 Tax=Ephemeroptericola cinctiostellae TaxID=2268024 RepID=A0A345DE91_9BURK|nr:hypothetical protein [Ephemeroptericola cinctiostellae]AXF86679.1 hypothetical protein DTO96_102434 [Ephemeroptericola cinctiostellae]
MTELMKMAARAFKETVEDALFSSDYWTQVRAGMTIINHLNGIKSGGEESVDVLHSV